MPRLSCLILSFFLLLSLTACDQSASETSTQQALLISGEADIQGSVSGKSGSSLTVRLENLSALPSGNAIIVEKKSAMEKPQQPVPFKLRVYRDQLQVGTTYILRIIYQAVDGRRWTNSRLYTIDRASEQTELGRIPLQPVIPAQANKAQLFLCGEKTVKLIEHQQRVQLHVQDDVYHLQPVVSASGARYQSIDEKVLFWNKGIEAMLSMADFDWPTCARVSQDVLALFPFRAHGNEPGWILSANVDEVVLDWNYGQQHLVMPYPELDLTHSGFVLHSEANVPLLKVNVLHSLCRDSMSGRPYPQHVELHYGDLHLSGCGGDSYALLTGKEWIVEDIGGQGLIDFTRVTMQFDSEGRLSGHASCNQYTTAYEFSEQLDIADPIATRKSCAPALMKQEQRFLNFLSEVQQLDFDPTGALLLITANGRTITARR
ncbi:MAG: META domain-containing protein [Methylophaga sp.]|jgi:heat shock protein HslJ/membrane-bound inhibitor of C-type lysozyme|nr:META domain-containing protein [Methylophaga sp.]